MVWVVSRFRLKAPPGISSPCVSPLTSSGQRSRPSWASQSQKSVTLSPQPGGKPRKFVRTCGGIGRGRISTRSDKNTSHLIHDMEYQGEDPNPGLLPDLQADVLTATSRTPSTVQTTRSLKFSFFSSGQMSEYSKYLRISPKVHLTSLYPVPLVPVSARSKAWVSGRSPTDIVGSNPTAGMDAVSCECCVLSGTGLCGEPITRLEESYRLWLRRCV